MDLLQLVDRHKGVYLGSSELGVPQHRLYEADVGVGISIRPAAFDLACM